MIRKVNQHLSADEDLLPRVFIPMLELKFKQLKLHSYLIHLYYLPKIYQEIFYTYKLMTNNTDEFMTVKMNTLLWAFNIIVYAFILWNFRPRGNWPDFYRLGLSDLAAN